MSRPLKQRRVSCHPGSDYFKPRGIPLGRLEEVALELSELEAMRLADLEGRHQEDAAQAMGISRQTFGNIIHSAHRKVAEALLEGKALRVGDGHAAADGPE